MTISTSEEKTWTYQDCIDNFEEGEIYEIIEGDFLNPVSNFVITGQVFKYIMSFSNDVINHNLIYFSFMYFLDSFSSAQLFFMDGIDGSQLLALMFNQGKSPGKSPGYDHSLGK